MEKLEFQTLAVVVDCHLESTGGGSERFLWLLQMCLSCTVLFALK